MIVRDTTRIDVLEYPSTGLESALDEPDFDYEEEEEVVEEQQRSSIDITADLFDDDEDEEIESDDLTIEEQETITLESLKKQNETLQQQLTQVSNQVVGMNNVQDSINRLGDRLQTQSQPQQQPGESNEEFSKRVKESGLLYEDPVNVVSEINTRLNGPIIQRVLDQNLRLQKQIMRIDPKRGELFMKYESEIDAEFNKLTPQQRYSDPDVYQKLYRVVISEHVDDLVEERLKEREGDGQTKSNKKQTAPYSASSRTKPEGKPRKKQPMSPEVKSKVEAFAQRRGMNVSDAYRFMRKNDLIKGVKK
jgi:hypothetical protein